MLTVRFGGVPFLSLLLFTLLPALSVQGGEKGAPFKTTGSYSTMVCVNCHGWRNPVLKQRKLNQPHDTIVFDHGAGQLWCFSCHKPKNPSRLHGLPKHTSPPLNWSTVYAMERRIEDGNDPVVYADLRPLLLPQCFHGGN